jgi:radical SAM protein with 4Fe4S-binding SPASM domain
MSLVGGCAAEYVYGLNPKRKEYFEQQRLYSLQVCPTYRCGAGCAYCLFGCKTTTVTELPYEVLWKALEDAANFGVKSVSWQGGDPLLYPGLWEMVDCLSEMGVGSNIFTNGLIAQKDAENLIRLATSDHHYECTIVHIDTISQEVYNRINQYPKNLGLKKAGYRRLLEAGHPPERVMGVITLTKQAIETIEETIDWFIDEMGAGSIGLCGFKPGGTTPRDPEFEPSLAEHRRAHEYRAKKLGLDWLEAGGATMVGSLVCQTDIIILADGEVCGCLGIPLGNIYQGDIPTIYNRERDRAIFRGKVEGKCSQCEYNPFCVGCRGAAYAYLGNPWAADPKCWRNPEAKDYYLS